MRISSPQPDEQDRLAWTALAWSGRIGPAGFMRLLARFGSAAAVLEAPEGELAAPSLRLKPNQIEAITGEARAHCDRIEAELASLADDGIAVICLSLIHI